MNEQNENGLPVEAASRSSDGLEAAERLAVRLLLENHGEEADALMTLNLLMRVYLHDDEPLTKDAKELRDMLLEVLESWLPKGNHIVDDLDAWGARD